MPTSPYNNISKNPMATTWRPTVFGDSLDSYCAARLLAKRAYLLGGGARGGMADNRRLLGKFEPMDDDL